ncbi:MAG: DUF465 domain-containing protein [Croceibacterium sp.]
MKSYLEELRRRHRRLDRLIDGCRAPGQQDELKQLKRLRLLLKDKMAAIERRRRPAPG